MDQFFRSQSSTRRQFQEFLVICQRLLDIAATRNHQKFCENAQISVVPTRKNIKITCRQTAAEFIFENPAHQSSEYLKDHADADEKPIC